MFAVVANISDVKLPAEILSSFNTTQLEFIKTEEGVMIRPFGETIRKTRGILKRGKFNSKVYIASKVNEKELEL